MFSAGVWLRLFWSNHRRDLFQNLLGALHFPRDGVQSCEWPHRAFPHCIPPCPQPRSCLPSVLMLLWLWWMSYLGLGLLMNSSSLIRAQLNYSLRHDVLAHLPIPWLSEYCPFAFPWTLFIHPVQSCCAVFISLNLCTPLDTGLKDLGTTSNSFLWPQHIAPCRYTKKVNFVFVDVFLASLNNAYSEYILWLLQW